LISGKSSTLLQRIVDNSPRRSFEFLRVLLKRSYKDLNDPGLNQMCFLLKGCMLLQVLLLGITALGISRHYAAR